MASAYDSWLEGSQTDHRSPAYMGKQDSCVETVRAALRKHPGFIAEALLNFDNAEAIANAYVAGDIAALNAGISRLVDGYLSVTEEDLAGRLQGRSMFYPSEEDVLKALGNIWEVAA